VYYTTSFNTQSSAPEDGRGHRPKHVELIGIINKSLLLQLVPVYIIYINDARSNKYQIHFNIILHPRHFTVRVLIKTHINFCFLPRLLHSPLALAKAQ
jgi:hypothetical protein